jgi:hypothetical protein
MGTITTISDLDSVRWPNSHWRSVKVYHDFRIHVLLFIVQWATCQICSHVLHSSLCENYTLMIDNCLNFNLYCFRLVGMSPLLVRNNREFHYGKSSP